MALKLNQSKTEFDSSTALKELKDQINEIGNNYKQEISFDGNQNASDGLEMEFKRYDSPDDEELALRAQSIADEYATVNGNKLKGDAASKSDSLNRAKEDALYELEKSLASSDGYYQDARKASSDSALKRGLSRSSIAQLNQEAINAAQASTKSKLTAETGRAVAKLDADILATQTALDAALGELDIKKAAKYQEDLNELKDEREKKQNEVLEYNNTLKERIQKLANDSDTNASNFLSASSNRIETAARTRDEAYYQKISAYLSSLPKADARKQFSENPYFKSLLTPTYISLITNAINAR